MNKIHELHLLYIEMSDNRVVTLENCCATLTGAGLSEKVKDCHHLGSLVI